MPFSRTNQRVRHPFLKLTHLLRYPRRAGGLSPIGGAVELVVNAVRLMTAGDLSYGSLLSGP